MLQPVELNNFFIAAMAGALLILSGACYALLFALARINGKRWVMGCAYLAYALLLCCVLVLARALHLTGFWQWLVACMVLGYLLAPHAVWALCVGTHPKHQLQDSGGQ